MNFSPISSFFFTRNMIFPFHFMKLLLRFPTLFKKVPSISELLFNQLYLFSLVLFKSLLYRLFYLNRRYIIFYSICSLFIFLNYYLFIYCENLIVIQVPPKNYCFFPFIISPDKFSSKFVSMIYYIM